MIETQIMASYQRSLLSVQIKVFLWFTVQKKGPQTISCVNARDQSPNAMVKVESVTH